MFAIDRMKEFAFPPSRPKINIVVVSRWVVRSVVAGVLLELGASVADAVSLFDSGGQDKTALLVANSTEITLLSLIIVSFILICLACLFRIRLVANCAHSTAHLCLLAHQRISLCFVKLLQINPWVNE
jgi:hypothetical protein